MTLRLSVLMLCVSGLASGCARATNECVWTELLYYGSDNVVDWLAANDPALLAKVVSHNEKRAEFCR
jgi:hypothetical protein